MHSPTDHLLFWVIHIYSHLRTRVQGTKSPTIDKNISFAAELTKYEHSSLMKVLSRGSRKKRETFFLTLLQTNDRHNGCPMSQWNNLDSKTYVQLFSALVSILPTKILNWGQLCPYFRTHNSTKIITKAYQGSTTAKTKM